MRSSTYVVAVLVAGALAACSEPQTYEDSSLARDLDLALTQNSANAAVVSPVEGGVQKAKPHTAATPSITRVARAKAHASHARAAESSPAQVAAEAAPQPAEEVVAESPAPETASQPQPAPQPEPVQTGRDGGRFPEPGGDIGVRIPGGGVIIIRGGAGSGIDPCVLDHPGRGGRGGGVLINPRLPGFPGGGGGFPGGVILR